MQSTVMRALMSSLLFCVMVLGGFGVSSAIDVKLTMDEAKKALAAGREPMEAANNPDEVKKIVQQAAITTRVGADPEKDPCGPNALLRTKRYWLESFGSN